MHKTHAIKTTIAKKKNNNIKIKQPITFTDFKLNNRKLQF